ncbi:MAG: LysR family transcriptional regulator [Psychromonas sp.]
MPSVEQINAFVEVYETQSYSVAARKLNKGRTTVRELVMTLEDQMDLSLFATQGRKLIASQEARKLYFHAKLLQQQLMIFEDLALTANEQQEEHITLCYDPMLSNDFMVEITLLLHQKFPNVHLHWVVKSWQEAIDLVIENVSHIAFLATKKENFPDLKIQYTQLGSLKFNVYCSTNNELTTLPIINQLHLRNTTQILPQNVLNSDVNGYLRYATQYIAVQSNDDVCRIIEKMGWALLPESHALAYVKQKKIVKLHPDFLLNSPQISMSSYYSPALNRGPALSYLLELIVPLAKKYFH